MGRMGIMGWIGLICMDTLYIPNSALFLNLFSQKNGRFSPELPALARQRQFAGCAGALELILFPQAELRQQGDGALVGGNRFIVVAAPSPSMAFHLRSLLSRHQ